MLYKLHIQLTKLLSLINFLLPALILLSSLLTTPAKASNTAGALVSGKVVTIAKPEVWGYDFRDHALIPKGFELFGLIYKSTDNDIVFKMRRCVKNCDKSDQAKYEYAMLWFLAGKIEFVDNDPLTSGYKEQHKLETLDNDDRAELLNGECIRTVHFKGGTLCQENDLLQNLLIKGQCSILDDPYKIMNVESDFKTIPGIKRYTIIGSQGDIYRYIDKKDGYCDRGGPGGGELIYQQLYPMQSIIGLKDGTFIVAGGGNLLVRFDGNFKTKFTPKHDIKMAFDETIKGNFFVLPYDKIKELNKVVLDNKDHGVQGLHDELLLYLYRREENK